MLSQRYKIGDMVGEGSFGSVFVCTSKETGEKRALKLLKATYSFDEIINLREFQSIQSAGYHPFIVELFEVHRVQCSSAAVLVFEFMPDGSLHSHLYHRFINKLGPPSDHFIRRTIYQVLQALEHLHCRGWMHRDVKPDNLLLKGDTCKLADFSLARPCSHFHEDAGGGGPMTQSVATLWYRAPEIVLLAHDYSSPVDIFGLGCVAAEMFRLKPLFPSRNDADMLSRLLKMLGNPKTSGWNQGHELLEKRGSYLEIDTNEFLNTDFRSNLMGWLTSGSVERDPGNFLDMLIGMMCMNPSSRLTASQVLQSSYFHQKPTQNICADSSMFPTGRDDKDIDSSIVTTSPQMEQETFYRTASWEQNQSIQGISSQRPRTFVLKRCK